MQRLFIAIDFPPSVCQQLALLCHGLKGVRWIPEEQLHLTLRFLGAVEGSMANNLREALGEIRFAPFELALHGMGVFPPRGRPNVLWAGVAPCPPLMDLQKRVEKAVISAGVVADKRRFAPHVTIGRVKQHPQSRQVADWMAHHALFGTPPFGVESFRLYSSVLTPGGALHRPEAEFPLTPRGS